MSTSPTMDLAFLKSRLRGRNLKKLLKEKNVTKYMMAKDLNISKQAIINWAHGLTPSDRMAILAGRYLGLIEPIRAERQRIRRQINELKKQIKQLRKN